MHKTILGVAVSLAALTLSSALSAGDAKKSLEGDWTIVSVVESGKPLPGDAFKKMFIRGTATSLTPVDDGKELTSEKLEVKLLDGKKADFIETRNDKTKTKPGLLEFVGADSVKITWAEERIGKEGARPVDFDGGAGSVAFLLKRKAK